MTIPGNVELFAGLEPKAIPRMLDCFGAITRRLKKGEYAFHEGDRVNYIAIVLSGRVQVERFDVSGNRVILAALETGSSFAESFVCAGASVSPVSAVAVMDSAILAIPYEKIVHPCASACVSHGSLIENLVALVSRRNLMLNERIGILAKRTIRDKALAFLDAERQRVGVSSDGSFDARFSREAMADYLCVDRSALSRVLGEMKDEGLISFSNNRFTLLNRKRIDK